MKKVLLFAIAFLPAVGLFAQAPEGINYQAVARDVSGAEMPNTPVAVQVQILNSSLAVIYQEDHLDTTNAFGLFNLVIGQGQNPTTTFANINWASGPFYLKISIDANNSGLVNMGYTQLWSVPYALYAKESANGPQGLPGVNCWDINGDGVNDPGEDRNGDSQWNALDCQGDSGLIGATGPQGAQGPSGSQGIQGIQGVQGVQGIQGATGSTGTNGIHCWDLNGNGVNEIGEDVNSDGFWDANDCAGATGSVGANGIHCWDLNGNGVNEIGEDINSDGLWNANDCNGATGVAGTNGLHCWDANGNGVNEIGEDINSDGFWDANDCIGATGAVGPQGPTGAAGTNGTNGTNGVTGPTGLAGTNGTNGVTGPTGTNGTNGVTGPTGLTGANGTNGATGATGLTGTNGTNGATGPTGLTGTNGTNGVTGATGPSGNNGTNGVTGPTGLTGTNGTNGTNGATGPTGPTGPSGSVGTVGSPGAPGATGPTGPSGPSGANGTSGTNGATGPTGLAGTNGTTGATGPSGANGTSGSTGAMGPTGNNGTNGVTGPTGPSWTLSTLTYSPSGTLTLTGTAGSGGPITSTTGSWLTTGNTGTNAGTNFIGTTDPVDLVFRTSNGPRMQIGAGGNVGIGISNPGVRLGVFGSGNTSATASFEVKNSSGTSMFYVRDDLKIGVGNTAPTARFEIWGTGASSASSAFFVRDNSGNPILYASDDRRVTFGSTTNTLGRVEVWGFGNTSATTAFNVVNTSGTSMLNVRDDGHVGIGTTTPIAALTVGNDKFQVSSAEGDVTFTDVNASITFPATSAGAPPMIYMFDNGTSNPNRMILGHSPFFPDWGLMYSDAGDKFLFTNSNGVGAALTVNIGTSAVGINNTNPTNALDVNGTTSTSGFIMAPGAAAGKVMSSDATGTGSWEYPLAPTKFGFLNSVYATNNSSQYSYTPVVLTVTPTQSGVLNLVCEFGYNFTPSVMSLMDFGLYISTSATPPNASTPFTNTALSAGYATTFGTASFGNIPVSIIYSMNVAAGQTYYIYVGALDTPNSAQPSANMTAPRIIATLNGSAGL